MRQLGLYFKYFVFWLFVFFLQRTVFIAFNIENLNGVCFSSLLKSYLYGLWIDVSAASYLLIIVVTVFLLGYLFRDKKSNKGIKLTFFLSLVVIFISSLLVVIDVGLVSTWGVKINAKAISYIFYPALVFSVIGSVNYMALIVTLIIMSGLLMYSYRYFFDKAFFDFDKKSFLLSIILIPFLIVGVRGGVQKFSIGKSNVFIGDNFTLNYASLNSLWNFMDVLIYLDKFNEKMYDFYSEEELNKLSDSFISGNNNRDSVLSVLKDNKDINIILIIVESFGSDNIQKLGGQDIAPRLNSLFDSALVFKDFYANGFRTEHGLVALLSGFPPFPKYALLRESDKLPYLPNLANALKDSLGYNSQFYFTSSLAYAHTGEYLNHGGFARVYCDNDFQNYRRHRSGAYDEDLFDFILKDKAKAKQPFFSVVLTSTTHTPWDAQVNKVFGEKTPYDKYKNAVHYADSCIYAFIMKASKEDWGKKTLFVITGDHTVGFNKAIYAPVRYKVPLIFYGNVLKPEYRGKVLGHPVSQIDFPKTILNQLGLKSNDFHIGNDMFDEKREHFAFYTYDNGIGVISKERQLSFSLDTKTAVYSQPDSLYTRELVIGKAFLQTMYTEFAKLNLKAVR
ncbi:MAG: sulfatase-like hydrolase/transferase [Desulfobulbaceae bacterium]|nr:sulfatase-like hydrolase/transferase [Desulfobulbaceae bacterium]